MNNFWIFKTTNKFDLKNTGETKWVYVSATTSKEAEGLAQTELARIGYKEQGIHLVCMYNMNDNKSVFVANVDGVRQEPRR